MGALIGLFFLLVLLGGDNHPHHVCPQLRSEVRPVYSDKPSPTNFDQNAWWYDAKNNRYLNITMATITLDMVSVKALGRQIGEEPDPEAIAYNKKVKECQTINGEF